MKSNVNVSIAQSSWDNSYPISQYVSININEEVDINFMYEEYNNILSSQKSDLYLTILDFLGYSLIGSGQSINSMNNNFYPIHALLSLNSCFNYDMHEAFIKAKDKFNHTVFGDNNIVVNIIYDNCNRNPLQANISFPNNYILTLHNDGSMWDGNYESLCKLILAHIVTLTENVTCHKAQNNIFLEDIFQHLHYGRINED